MSSDTISNLSELEKYINSFIDKKYVFFHQEALDFYSALVEDNFSYNQELKKKKLYYSKLTISQNEYMNKIKNYLILKNYNNREIISLIKNLDTFYNQCFERSILLKNNLESLYLTIKNDNKSDVKLKMLNAIKYEMEKYIRILLQGERKMLQEKLKINPLPQQHSKQKQLPPPSPPREQPHPNLQQQQYQPQKQSQQQVVYQQPTREPSHAPLLLQGPPQQLPKSQMGLPTPLLPQIPQTQLPPAPRLLPRPPVKQNGENMAKLLKTHFYKTKYNKIKDGNEQVIKYNISTVPHIKYTDDNDVIIDMMKGNTQINLETTNKYVYNFKEKKIINGIQDIGIFLKESKLKSIKYFLKSRESGQYLEITINIPFIILSDNDTHIYLTYTDISSTGTYFDLGDYIRSLIDIIKNYVRKQDPLSFL
jgi:hypothetical protein